jgi:hypothetical protein
MMGAVGAAMVGYGGFGKEMRRIEQTGMTADSEYSRTELNPPGSTKREECNVSQDHQT